MGEKEPAPNRFEADLEELSAPQRKFATATLRIATATFAGFEDAKASHYYCAPDRTPEETWLAVTEEVARVTAIVAGEAEAGDALVSADLDGIHRGIFKPVFGEQVLRPRRFRDQVTYGIVKGPREDPAHSMQRGKSAKRLERSLEKNISELQEAIDERDRLVREGSSRRVLDATLPAARAYGRFLADHPYFDGNGRTAFPLLSFALIRLGLVAVAVPETQEFHWCLGRAMRRSHRDPGPLADYLKDLIIASDTGGDS